MRILSFVIALAAVIATHAAGPAFESVSVRENPDVGTPSRVGTTMTVTPGGIQFREVSLLNCITEAWGITAYQIRGLAPWMRTVGYDIAARHAGAATREQSMAMLRQLLYDHFALRTHLVQEPMRVSTLVVTRGGPRLTAAAGEGEFRLVRDPAGAGFRQATMADLAGYLSRSGPVGVPVLDRTGITGRFDFTLPLLKKIDGGSGEDAKRAIAEDGGPTIYDDALADLGLAMKRETLPTAVVVIDSAQRP